MDLSLSKPQFLSVSGTQFPFRRKGLRKDRRKNVQREGDREERKLQKGNSEFEIVRNKNLSKLFQR